MDIFEFAMKMEKDGAAYYRHLAARSTNPGVTDILNRLADEEMEHLEVVKKLKEGSPVEVPPAAALAGAANVFAEMAQEALDTDLLTSQIDLYRRAQDTEQKSQNFYTKKAGEVADAAQREILLQLAEQERQHYFLLDNIIKEMTGRGRDFPIGPQNEDWN